MWLESLSMHLSVGMPLPSDLLFDIQHYRGISPSSSGSTTPEGITSGHRSPALEPITEGRPAVTKTSSAHDIKKIASTENVKPIIKVVEDTKPNLKIEVEKIVPIRSVGVEKKIESPTTVKLDSPRLNCLRKVPKNFIRNRFSNEKFDFNDLIFKDTEEKLVEKPSSLSLQGLKSPSSPSKVTQKFVSRKIEDDPFQRNKFSYRSLRDFDSTKGCTSKSGTNYSISKNIFKQNDVKKTEEPLFRLESIEEKTKKSFDEQKKNENAKPSSSIVKIIESLNRKDRGRFEFPRRGAFGRSSLKVSGSQKMTGGRSCSPEELTSL